VERPPPKGAPNCGGRAVCPKVAELNKALGTAAGAAGIGGDRTSLALHHADKKLIEAVAAVNRRTRGP
jgi:hypothetical protein